MVARCDPISTSPASTSIATRSAPRASSIRPSHLVVANMLRLELLPPGSFDVVHEFGATYLVDDWAKLARSYLELTRPGGIVLWELPSRWSMAHGVFMALPAMRREGEPTWRRLLRSLSPSKFTFESGAAIRRMLDESGIGYEIVDEVPIWSFFIDGPPRRLLDRWPGIGARAFDRSTAPRVRCACRTPVTTW